MKETVIIFGESEKGDFGTLIPIDTLPQLASRLGNPTEGGLGMHLAIGAMMFNKNTIYYRVEEEGIGTKGYLHGLSLLLEGSTIPHLTALALPGVGDSEIINHAERICRQDKALLIMNEKDLYDLLTQ